MVKSNYDVIVIGGGIGGFAAAIMANSLGKKVAIVEKDVLGGNCTWHTCSPAKALVEAASLAWRSKNMGDFGLKLESPLKIDTQCVMAYIQSVIRSIYKSDSPESFERIGIKIINGQPKFIDRHNINLNGNTISSEKFIIATGSRPLVPNIDGLSSSPYLTNESFFKLKGLPRSMIILGGGPAGIEIAQASNRLGTQVKIIELADRILFRDDAELVSILTQQLIDEGVEIYCKSRATKVEGKNKRITVTTQDTKGNEKKYTADCLLIALGRKANVEGLDLEKAKVQYTDKGIVTDARLRTTASNIYACGDVVGPYQFASLAEYQAIIAVENALLPIKRKVDYKNLAWVTFVDPGLTHCGLTEEEARRKYRDKVEVIRYPYERSHRAKIDLGTDGMAKVILEKNGRLLGAHILGNHSEDLIHEFQVTRALNIPMQRLHSILHAFPTYSEGIAKRIADLCYVNSMRRNKLIRFALKILPGYSDNMNTIDKKI